jgi:phytoene dehydrogenase-like protein
MTESLENGSMSRRDFMKLAAAISAMLNMNWTLPDVWAEGARPDQPVVVIGAGLGGLSAAALLTRNGFPVCVIEQHEKPGGYATSFDRDAGRYTFEVSLHATGSPTVGLKPVLEGAGIADKVHMVKLPEFSRIKTPDYDLRWPESGPEAMVQELVRLFPGEASGIRGFFEEMAGILDELSIPFNTDSEEGRASFPETHKRLWAVRNKTVAEMLDGFVHDEKARALMTYNWSYYGLPPSRLSGFYFSMATASYLRDGSYYVKTRSQDLSDALSDSIQAAGGKILLETRAEGIVTEGKKITGVRLSDGRTIPACAVVSNASVPATVKMLPADTLPGNYLEKLKSYRPSLSCFQVWLGLKGDIKEKIAVGEALYLRQYDFDKTYQALLACDPLKTNLRMTIYDNFFEGYSQPGTSTVSIIMLSGYEPWRRFEADYFAGRKDEYRKEKERIANLLIDEAERHFVPGLKSMIEVIETATPLTNMRYTGNPEGAIYGYEQTVDNAFMNRLQVKTPLKGLYFASAWSSPGGGYEPCLASGATACKALMEDWPAGA